MVTLLALYSIKLTAQLSSTDSIFFNYVFTDSKYINSVPQVGKWYIYDSLKSMSAFNQTMDSVFKFNIHDLDSLNTLNVSTELSVDSAVNLAFNQVPYELAQTNPFVSIPFSLNLKSSSAYAYFTPTTNSDKCKKAFLIIPGSGINLSTEVIKGLGYHCAYCNVKATCAQFGDVFIHMKPNEDVRAIYWNNKKLNTYIFSSLASSMRHYGINYLIEIIATLKYMKAHYNQVYILGLSEGGYATLLATMFEEPTGAIVSAGYSINFDTYAWSNATLRMRFDSLLDVYDRNGVYSTIQNSSTKYLFTWGDQDPVPLMQDEHDSNFTRIFLDTLPNCNFYYNYTTHTFPQCPIIDSFVNSIPFYPNPNFYVKDSLNSDSIRAEVRFCSVDLYSIDLYRDTTFLNTYTFYSDSLVLTLSDSGKYYLQNIQSISKSLQGACADTVIFEKLFPTSYYSTVLNKNLFKIGNPFQNQLQVNYLGKDKFRYKIFNILGSKVDEGILEYGIQNINTTSWKSGLYIFHVEATNGTFNQKLLKSN